MLFSRRKPVVLHIMMREKHTSGYISFLKLMLPEYAHVFAIRNKGFNTSRYYELKVPNKRRVHVVEEYNSVFSDPGLRKAAIKAEKIVFSGVWYAAPFMNELLQHPDFLKKTWIQFWGGDYVCFQSEPQTDAGKQEREILFRAFRDCAGLVFLTSGEYEQFHQITGIENRHMTAPVPKDPRRKAPSEYESERPHAVPRILVGNSANTSSNHLRVLKLLHSAFPEEVFDVICPLSYGGNKAYIREVKALGRQYFNEHFIPLMKFMEPEDYTALLADCDLGIFDYERQQGLGNIGTLLRFGKKVYLNPDSPLWHSLAERGCVLFSVKEIGSISFRDFLYISDSDRQKNREASDLNKRNAEKAAQWRALLKA